jgi:hypothetical protein
MTVAEALKSVSQVPNAEIVARAKEIQVAMSNAASGAVLPTVITLQLAMAFEAGIAWEQHRKKIIQ